MNCIVHIIPLYILQNFMRMNKLLNIYLYIVYKYVCIIKSEYMNYKSKVLMNCEIIDYNNNIIVLLMNIEKHIFLKHIWWSQPTC